MNNYGYVQVTMTTMLNRETEDREYAPLEMIKDNYPKYVLTRNDMIQKEMESFMKIYRSLWQLKAFLRMLQHNHNAEFMN